MVKIILAIIVIACVIMFGCLIQGNDYIVRRSKYGRFQRTRFICFKMGDE